MGHGPESLLGFQQGKPTCRRCDSQWLVDIYYMDILGYGSRLLTRWPKMFVILRGNQPFFVISTNERIMCFFFGCEVHMPGMIYDNDHQLQSNGIQNHQLFSSWSSVMVPTFSRTMWESFENQSTNWRKKWWTSIPKSVFCTQVKGWHFWVREDGRTLHKVSLSRIPYADELQAILKNG